MFDPELQRICCLFGYWPNSNMEEFMEDFMILFSKRVMLACLALALVLPPLASLAAPGGERFIVKFKDGRNLAG
jgi:hypothetical protein